MKIILTLIVLFSFNYASSQLFYCSKDKRLLIDKGEELPFIYKNEAHISAYRRDSTHISHWSLDRKYPNRFGLDSFLGEYKFKFVDELIPIVVFSLK